MPSPPALDTHPPNHVHRSNLSVSQFVIRLLASGATLLLLDQWSKRAVQLLTPRRFVTGVPFVYIRRVANLNKIYRSARARAGFVFVWSLALISALILHRSGIWFQGRISQIGLGLAFGGAAGNLLDIVRQQSVVDFIDLRWWPVFNVADIGIVGGLLLAFWR
jgi:signal peptidase II